jgi:hypothetical protein
VGSSSLWFGQVPHDLPPPPFFCAILFGHFAGIGGVCRPCGWHTLVLNFKLSFVLAILFGTIKVRTCGVCALCNAHTPHSLFRSLFCRVEHNILRTSVHVMSCHACTTLPAFLSPDPLPPSLPAPGLPDVLLAEPRSVLGARETQFRPPGVVHKLIFLLNP